MEVKPAFETNRICLGKASPLSSPVYIIIDTSEVCNLKCNYCFRSHDIKEYGYALKNEIMSMETFKKIVDSIDTFSEEPRKISLSASGEPLVNKNIPEMVKYLKEKVSTPIEFFTNGVLLNEEYAMKIAESGIDKIVVSVQGITSEKYKEVCGRAIDMDKFVANLKVLYDNSTNTKIFVKIADIALEDGDEEKFYKMFKECCNYAYIEKITENFWDAKDKKKFTTISRFGLEVPFQRTCSHLVMMFSIAPNGDIYPCCQPLCPINFGNINDISLRDAWDSKKRVAFLKRNLIGNGREDIPACGECEMAQCIIDIENDSIEDYREEVLKRLEDKYSY